MSAILAHGKSMDVELLHLAASKCGTAGLASARLLAPRRWLAGAGGATPASSVPSLAEAAAAAAEAAAAMRTDGGASISPASPCCSTP